MQAPTTSLESSIEPRPDVAIPTRRPDVPDGRGADVLVGLGVDDPTGSPQRTEDLKFTDVIDGCGVDVLAGLSVDGATGSRRRTEDLGVTDVPEDPRGLITERPDFVANSRWTED
ncbi:hypothetical protein AALP_AA8G165400 [Arabis alpina]|uniref:Uncharacterized protein n=1 Tax=Arabis alpina TaxID=50452 RepID=A0A087G7G6_ARAAL|nr:hypothetical protein AALP_AA8G165400 [Arabis alpina]